MSVAYEYLKKKEWSMGNGQCPECCGHPPKWFGHPLYLTPESIGHEKECPLALALQAQGGNPLFLGDFKSNIEYEDCTTLDGTLTTRVKGQTRDWLRQETKKLIWDDKFDQLMLKQLEK